jgi:N-acetylglucosamine kinase-like BadF-type ATPase
MKKYLLSIDGGGTKTIGVISDENGEILKVKKTGSCSREVVGIEGEKEVIISLIKKILEETKVEKIDYAVFGLTGVDLPEDVERVENFIKDLRQIKNFLVENDSLIAWAASTLGKPGIVVSAGTGTIAFGINKNGDRMRSSGWGWLVGDEGSGFDIGRKGIISALKYLDGRGEETILLNLIPEKMQLPSIIDVVLKIYEPSFPKAKIAEIAPVVIEAAKIGDRVAKRILENAGKDLAEACNAVIKRLNMENEKFIVGCAGRIFKSNEIIFNSFKEEVNKFAKNAIIIYPRYDSVIGGIIIAMEKLNIEINEKILKNLDSTYKRDYSP